MELLTKQTSPQKRYSEATLIKKLEDLGIGRPSTYASTITVLLDPTRGYVTEDHRSMVPTPKGINVIRFLDKAFPDIVNLNYTAQMEDSLDKISNGKLNDTAFLTDVYGKLQAEITAAKTLEGNKVAPVLVGRKCPKCGKDLVYRIGRFGKFIACSGYNGKKTGCNYTERIGADSNPLPPKEPPVFTKVKCPKCGKLMVQRKNKKTGEIFYACSGFPKCHEAMSKQAFNKYAADQSIPDIAKDSD